MDHEAYMLEALKEAEKARCARSRCGAVIVSGNTIIGRGYNAPPQDDHAHRKCDTDFRTSRKPKSDRTCCVHAEWRAIIDALTSGTPLTGSTLYFVRSDKDGRVRHCGSPYCTVCSRLALDVGIGYFALWHTDGVRCYNTSEYNDLSYAYHGNTQGGVCKH